MKTQQHMKSYKVGSIVLATAQGLGYMAKDFFDNGIFHEVYIRPHNSRDNHYEWYPNRCSSIEELLDKIDTLLLFETPFDWNIIKTCRERGIKTVLMVMYECTKYPLPYEPDLILCPSELDLQYYPNGTLINIPTTIKWKLRENARTFVFNAGNGGIGGRNGTQEILESIKYIKSPINFIIRSQVPINIIDDSRVKFQIGTFDNIWEDGDVFVFPEKFNGLSLPLQEAFASGMLVMAGARFPMTRWLPNEPLIPVEKYSIQRIAVEFDCAEYSPIQIANTIDRWYNKNITEFSLLGKEFNYKNSWNNLKDTYMALMSR